MEELSTYKIRPRRGSKSDWFNINPILLEGELGVEYPDSTGLSEGHILLKVGDGITRWNELPYAFDINEADSIRGGSSEYDTSKLISLRSDTQQMWIARDPVLELGEIVYETTSQLLKVGDGIHKYSELRYIGKTWDVSAVFDFGDYDADQE